MLSDCSVMNKTISWHILLCLLWRVLSTAMTATARATAGSIETDQPDWNRGQLRSSLRPPAKKICAASSPLTTRWVIRLAGGLGGCQLWELMQWYEKEDSDTGLRGEMEPYGASGAHCWYRAIMGLFSLFSEVDRGVINSEWAFYLLCARQTVGRTRKHSLSVILATICRLLFLHSLLTTATSCTLWSGQLYC